MCLILPARRTEVSIEHEIQSCPCKTGVKAVIDGNGDRLVAITVENGLHRTHGFRVTLKAVIELAAGTAAEVGARCLVNRVRFENADPHRSGLSFEI
jgi:hypothetical protein